MGPRMTKRTALHPSNHAGEPASNGLSAHILPTSATMIGVCMTSLYISLLGPLVTRRVIDDKLMAIIALVVLASAVLSFMSMRSERFGPRLEGYAEWVFLTALALLALGAVVLAFAVT